MTREFGPVKLLGVEVIGQPGQRRFYLFFRSVDGRSAVLWMEKEQLNRLSLTLDHVLAQLSEGQVLRTEAQAGSQATPAGRPADFPRTPEDDFRNAQMSLIYDRRKDRFIFSLVPVELLLEEGEEPQGLVHEEDTLSFSFTQPQAVELSRTITILLTSGRPVCPLCHAVLDGGPHACEKQNGHHEIVQILEEEDEA